MEGLTGSGKGGTSGSFRSRLEVAPASPFADYIHDGISKCAMGVGWAQRLIVPTISRSAEFVHIGGHGNAVPALHDFREPDVPAAILCGPVRAAWAGVHISGSSRPTNAASKIPGGALSNASQQLVFADNAPERLQILRCAVGHHIGKKMYRIG